MDPSRKLSRSLDISARVASQLQRRLATARDNYNRRVREAWQSECADAAAVPATPWDVCTEWYRYSVDAMQRTVLFWDTLRLRGNNYVEHVQQGQPPVLHFAYETVMDGREFERPVNYALLRIVPPEGVAVDDRRRPYIIIDPRAGHGPGIGGFKDDSQVGVALRDGHPVYFVMFHPDPEPGQTLPDVTEAERRFVKRVRERHPDSPKPVLVGNCQGGWAAMMLAAADAGEVGPIVINGAPMSYWSGASLEGQADNPMRYAGGNLGGTWLASFSADLGNGVFDGAHLVQNFENLNPANSYWDKYRHLYASIDSEPPRFLEFERWWGGFFLMNRAEIEWITQNLFVGNDVWAGTLRARNGPGIDLRNIRTPIVLFASMGDNITPAQQAFNWVADVYGSTDEIKARGQVIVGLLHRSIGHLGIFVSGSVAKKEHAQIVSVMKSIEALPPGLYGMEITERAGADGKPEYDVAFREQSLEEVAQRCNRPDRIDEKPFEAVEVIADFNQRAYELFAQPLVQALSNDFTARLGRELHPLRVQRWAFSDLNPWLAWLRMAAPAVRAQRQALPPEAPSRRVEAFASALVSAGLDYWREVRDAASEAQFFQVYGNVFALYLADRRAAEAPLPAVAARELPYVKEALASIEEGGYAEALARVGVLLARKGEPLPLSRVALRAEIGRDYADLFPGMTPDQWRRIRGEQEIIVRYEPEQALLTLPKLLDQGNDRERFLAVVERLTNDPRIQAIELSAEQNAMLARLYGVLEVPGTRPRLAAVRAR
jgi:pimeloyl-ACP methyl ester carboxylesterase